MVRSSALAIREVPYVDAARACGFGHARIILRHMVPNVMAPFLIMLTAFVGQAILARSVAVLSGAGRAGADPGLGPDAAGRRRGIRRERAVDRDLPGLAITLAVFGFNLFGDALRDALDPKLRSL